MKKLVVLLIIAALVAPAVADVTGWDAFVVRNNGTVINDVNATTKEFITSASGMKAAWGTGMLDGQTVGDITLLAISRLDDASRFAPGSGPAVAPYFNIWITDGAGKYAVIANEPSDAVFQAHYNQGYDLIWSDISGLVAKVYETSDKSWLPNNGVDLKFEDLAGFTIKAPTVTELSAGWGGLGTGAPRELGTNVAYGFNWVFGDTLSNYVSGDKGYIVANPIAQGKTVAVPAPGALLLAGLGTGLVGWLRRRKA